MKAGVADLAELVVERALEAAALAVRALVGLDGQLCHCLLDSAEAKKKSASSQPLRASG
jgi:hypothetical protein